MTKLSRCCMPPVHTNAAWARLARLDQCSCHTHDAAAATLSHDESTWLLSLWLLQLLLLLRRRLLCTCCRLSACSMLPAPAVGSVWEPLSKASIISSLYRLRAHGPAR